MPDIPTIQEQIETIQFSLRFFSHQEANAQRMQIMYSDMLENLHLALYEKQLEQIGLKIGDKVLVTAAARMELAKLKSIFDRSHRHKDMVFPVGSTSTVDRYYEFDRDWDPVSLIDDDDGCSLGFAPFKLVKKMRQAYLEERS